jgi:SAM-dependent methyltransferase
MVEEQDDSGVTFDTIYRDNLWNGVESRSGPGSGEIATRGLLDELRFVAELTRVESVLDVGCGDGFWMPDLPGYVGYDVSRIALELARERHPERDYTSVWPARSFDLVIVRDVIQHLSLAEGVALLDRVFELMPRYLLASTYRGGINIDIPTGGAYSPDLQAAPFGLPDPAYWIFDGYHYHSTPEVRDPTKYLGLWVANVGIVTAAT